MESVPLCGAAASNSAVLIGFKSAQMNGKSYLLALIKTPPDPADFRTEKNNPVCNQADNGGQRLHGRR